MSTKRDKSKKNTQSIIYNYYLFLWHEYNKTSEINEDRYALIESADDFKTIFSAEIKSGDFIIWNTTLTNKQFNILTTCNTMLSDLESKYPSLKHFNYDYFYEDISGDSFNVLCVDLRKLVKDCKGNRIKHLYQREYAYVTFSGDTKIDDTGIEQQTNYVTSFLFGTYAYLFYIKSKCNNLLKLKDEKDKINKDNLNEMIKMNEYIKKISYENVDSLINKAKQYYDGIANEYKNIQQFIKILLPSKQNIDTINKNIKMLKYNVNMLYECKLKIQQTVAKIECNRMIK